MLTKKTHTFSYYFHTRVRFPVCLKKVWQKDTKIRHVPVVVLSSLFVLFIWFYQRKQCGFILGMLHFSCFLFFINFQRYVHSICVWNMIKQSKSLQTRYNMTYIYDGNYIITHVYVFLFSVKKYVFEPWRWPRGGTPFMVFIGPVFHKTIKTCLKRVWHCGYEWVEKEMCRFAEDMS